jgi:hypothetical protein
LQHDLVQVSTLIHNHDGCLIKKIAITEIAMSLREVKQGIDYPLDSPSTIRKLNFPRFFSKVSTLSMMEYLS